MLVTLLEYQEQARDRYAWFVENAGSLPIHDGLILSALGARICYSNDHPANLLFNDKRVVDPEERVAFLNRLYKAGHFSVFAHSPVMFWWCYEDEPFVPPFDGRMLYKLWGFYDDWCLYYCANFRHVAEAFNWEGEDFEIVLRRACTSTNSSLEAWWIGKDGRVLKPVDSGDMVSESGVLCLFLREEPWQWFSFVAHGYSRIFSHQLVRHTWLNFSQRSHRYTKVDDVVIPPSVGRSARTSRVARDACDRVLSVYRVLVEAHVPKEDARFVTPAGVATTIMASGPRFVWEDFVAKRKHPKAQWEIREFAQVVEEVLKEVL